MESSIVYNRSVYAMLRKNAHAVQLCQFGRMKPGVRELKRAEVLHPGGMGPTQPRGRGELLPSTATLNMN